MKLMHNAIRKMGKQIVIIRNKERVEKMTREKLQLKFKTISVWYVIPSRGYSLGLSVV